MVRTITLIENEVKEETMKTKTVLLMEKHDTFLVAAAKAEELAASSPHDVGLVLLNAKSRGRKASWGVVMIYNAKNESPCVLDPTHPTHGGPCAAWR